jgi:hypothetical protein
MVFMTRGSKDADGQHVLGAMRPGGSATSASRRRASARRGPAASVNAVVCGFATVRGGAAVTAG